MWQAEDIIFYPYLHVGRQFVDTLYIVQYTCLAGLRNFQHYIGSQWMSSKKRMMSSHDLIQQLRLSGVLAQLEAGRRYTCNQGALLVYCWYTDILLIYCRHNAGADILPICLQSSSSAGQHKTKALLWLEYNRNDFFVRCFCIKPDKKSLNLSEAKC